MTDLPTPEEMLIRADGLLSVAYKALGDAAAELWSDWPPGCVMTEKQGARRTRMVAAIRTARNAIDEGRLNR